MPVEERRRQLLHGLKAGGGDEVYVNFSHLAHAIGMDEAEKLVEHMSSMHSIINNKYTSKPTYVRDGLCAINRLLAIEAVLSARAKSEKETIDRLTM
jgi:hypothetical protein